MEFICFEEDNEKIKNANMQIMNNALKHLKEMKELQKNLNRGGSAAGSGTYKYFQMSFKVYHLKPKIKEIYELIKTIAGDELNSTYSELVNAALSRKFINGGKAYTFMDYKFDDGVPVEGMKETNYDWIEQTSIILLAFTISNKILNKLIWICGNKSNMKDEELCEYAFTELNALFNTY